MYNNENCLRFHQSFVILSKTTETTFFTQLYSKSAAKTYFISVQVMLILNHDSKINKYIDKYINLTNKRTSVSLNISCYVWMTFKLYRLFIIHSLWCDYWCYSCHLESRLAVPQTMVNLEVWMHAGFNLDPWLKYQPLVDYGPLGPTGRSVVKLGWKCH